MIKRKKVVLSLLSVLVLAAIAAVAVFYLSGQNSAQKKQYEVQVKQEVKVFTDHLVAELDQIKPLTASTSGQGIVSSKSNTKQAADAKQQVLQANSAVYSKVLHEQKSQAVGMVNSLVAQGKADWLAAKAKGDANAATKGKLASEYLAKGQVLEAQMDASFNTLMVKMEAQLRAEGQDPAPVIEKYRAQYKAIKEQNRSAMLRKAMAQ